MENTTQCTPQIRHTSGPWTVEDPVEGELWIVQADKPTYEWRTIASIPLGDLEEGFPQEVIEANARLIAAAPSLLEALKALLDIAPFAKSSGDRQIHEQAQEAIARAVRS